MPQSQDKKTSAEKSILLVEDDLEMLQLIKQILSREGYAVIAINDSGDAMRRLEQNNLGPIDLLVSDLVMPKAGGLELASSFRSAYPDAKILLISGYAEEIVILKETLRKETYFMPKPLQPGEFKAKVADLLKNRVSGGSSGTAG